MLALAFVISFVLLLQGIYSLENQLPEARGLSAGRMDKIALAKELEIQKLAAMNVSVGSSCSSSSSCTVSGYEGACVSISSGCCSTGVVTSGLCSGSSDIKCCTQNGCTTPYGSGTCMQSSLCSSKGGSAFSGYCSGPSEIQCCVMGNAPVDNAQYGVDISVAISSSTASCFKSSGYSYIIPRGYRSSGSVDPNVCTNLKAAQAGGITVRDVYIFPCPTCSASASSQLSTLVNYLNDNCASYWSGRVWLDIEGTQYWGSYSDNKSFYQSLVDTCSSLKIKCGVYSSSVQWSAIFGSTSYSYGSSLPLWYAHYDQKASFSDFTPFGGWTSPHAKQFDGDTTACSTGVDRNYAISF